MLVTNALELISVYESAVGSKPTKLSIPWDSYQELVVDAQQYLTLVDVSLPNKREDMHMLLNGVRIEPDTNIVPQYTMRHSTKTYFYEEDPDYKDSMGIEIDMYD